MRTLPIPTGPAPAAESPPKKEAAPAKEAAKSSGEHGTSSTADNEAQGNPALELTKLLIRCGPKARRELLRDAKARFPVLWTEVNKEGP